MWRAIAERLPSWTVWFCAVLSALIPWSLHKITMKLREIGAPPWKKRGSK